MSGKRKWPRELALAVAKELQARLAPACRRIAIVGSLRRGKAEVGDAELLFVPVMSSRQIDMFSSEPVSVAHELCNEMLRDGTLEKRPNVNGQFAWGEANKLALHRASGLPVDLFQVHDHQWWVSLVIRTGSKETNLRLTTGANRQGATLNAYGQGVTWSDGSVTPATSEEQVFELCGVPYLKPEER